MKELKEIIRDIGEKLEDAECYAKEAVKHRAQYPELAASYARIAQEDLNHADLLHRSVVEMIENKKRQGAEVPESMQTIWDYEHEKQIEDAADVRRLLDMYKA